LGFQVSVESTAEPFLDCGETDAGIAKTRQKQVEDSLAAFVEVREGALFLLFDVPFGGGEAARETEYLGLILGKARVGGDKPLPIFAVNEGSDREIGVTQLEIQIARGRRWRFVGCL
jgi:hypothetical protein